MSTDLNRSSQPCHAFLLSFSVRLSLSLSPSRSCPSYLQKSVLGVLQPPRCLRKRDRERYPGAPPRESPRHRQREGQGRACVSRACRAKKLNQLEGISILVFCGRYFVFVCGDGRGVGGGGGWCAVIKQLVFLKKYHGIVYILVGTRIIRTKSCHAHCSAFRASKRLGQGKHRCCLRR